MYSALFSRIYNDFGWNYYPEAFAAALLKWIEEKGLHARSLLDLGCGTGVLCRILRENGMDAVGVDLSENMIAIAREQDPGGKYVTGDMTNYVPDHRVDLVTISGDAINHLPSLEKINEAFRNIYQALKGGGYLVFDLLNEKEVATDEPFTFDFSDRIKARFRMRRDGDVVRLEIKSWEDGHLTMTEVITERIYEVEKIRGLLGSTGFTNIVVSHRLSEKEGNEAVTWYVTAQKPLEIGERAVV